MGNHGADLEFESTDAVDEFLREKKCQHKWVSCDSKEAYGGYNVGIVRVVKAVRCLKCEKVITLDNVPESQVIADEFTGQRR